MAATGTASVPLRVVLLTGGHDYQRSAYLSSFDDMPDVSLSHVEHQGGPTASGWEHPDIDRCDGLGPGPRPEAAHVASGH